VAAQDRPKEFFARIGERQWLADANPGRGPFGNFLISALKYSFANESGHDATETPAGSNVSIGRYASDPPEGLVIRILTQ
jgi:hypothetical protein